MASREQAWISISLLEHQEIPRWLKEIGKKALGTKLPAYSVNKQVRLNKEEIDWIDYMLKSAMEERFKNDFDTSRQL